MTEKLGTIKIACKGSGELSIKLMTPFQGDLKTLDKSNLEKLKNEILTDGFSFPIGIWEHVEDNKLYILDGHQRYAALESLKKDGWIIPEIPIVMIEAESYEQAKHKLLAAASVYGTANEEGILHFLQDVNISAEDILKNINLSVDMDQLLQKIDVDLTRRVEVAAHTRELGIGSREEIENDVPQAPKKPTARLGDVFILGNHRLMCGDSTSEENVKTLMNGELADLVVTDPPYNVAVNDESEESLKSRNRRTDGLKIQNDNMSEFDFDKFLADVFKNYHTSMREGAAIYVFYADSMTIPFMSKFIEAGFHFAQNCIWNKQQFVMTRKDYHYKHEPIMYGWKLGKAHDWENDRKQSSVWSFDRPFRNELHPTMKPIDLVEYPIKNSSKFHSLVLDLFGGSGSTLIACEKQNRDCFMMELDPYYVDVIIARWENYTGKTAVHSNGLSFEQIRQERDGHKIVQLKKNADNVEIEH